MPAQVGGELRKRQEFGSGRIGMGADANMVRVLMTGMTMNV